MRPGTGEFKKPGFLPALGALGVATACAVLGVRSFDAAYKSQYALGAQTYAQARLRDGDAAAAERDLAEAHRALEYCARLFPWQRRFSERLGKVAFMRGDFDAAVTHFETALALDPDAPELHLRVAQALINRADAARLDGVSFDEDLARAKEYIDAAELRGPRMPGTAEASARLMLLYAEAPAEHVTPDTYRQGAALFTKRALEYGIHNKAGMYRFLGGVELARGNYEESRWALERAVEIAPASEKTWDFFAQLAEETGDATAYLDALQRALAQALESGANRTVAASLAVRVKRTFPTVEGNPPGVPAAVLDALEESP